MSETSTVVEDLTVMLAQQFTDDDVVFTGLVTGERTAIFAAGIPAAAAMLAQRTHAPNLTLMLAGWIANPDLTKLEHPPTSEFDPVLLQLPCEAHGQRMPGLFNFQRGDITVGFSSAAQMDRHGSMNTQRLNRPDDSTKSLVGPILIPEHMTLFGREVVMMPRHERRTFVEEVDYRCSPRVSDQRALAEKFGYPGSGASIVVTPRCVFDFDDDGLMTVRSVHRGNTYQDVIENTGFPLSATDDVPVTPAATAEYLSILCNEVDPHGALLGERRGYA